MAHNLSDPNNLTVVLRMLTEPSTVKNGEKILKPYLKNQGCVQSLMYQISSCPEPAVRHHAALLLKKKLPVHYKKYSAQPQAELRAKLLVMMAAEPERPVRTALAGAVAVTSKAVFSLGQQWPELFTALAAMAQDPNEKLRALDYSLLSQLAEQVSDHMKPHLQTLVQMFVVGCQDACSDVAEAALQATAAFVREMGKDQEIMSMQVVISPMLAVMGQCLENGNEDTVVEGLDVIQECCMLEAPLVNDHIELIVQFVMRVLQGKDFESALKQSAGQTLINILEFRPKLTAKKNLVAPILSALMTMIAQENPNAAGSLFNFSSKEGRLGEDDGDDEEESFSPEMDVQKLAQTTIDCMAINIPSKYFVDTALSLCGQGMTNPDPQMRKAGCAVLGVIAEGCCDKIRETMGEILPPLLNLVRDPEFYVRECACFALGQFAEYCQPDILHYNEVVMPVLIQALDDARPTVQGTCCYVLEYFCEGLQPATLRPYLNQLMTRLAGLLQAPLRSTQEMALSAIAATSVASEIEFLPYAETVCGILAPLLFSTDQKLFTLRGRSLECLGHIAVAIGGDNFGRYFETGMQSATQAISLNDEDLKEHSFVFIANCAKVMGKKYESYMPQMVPYLLEVISEREVFHVAKNDEEDDGDADDEENSVGDFRVNVEEGFINSKKAAISAIIGLAEHTQELFVPYLKSTMDALLMEDMGAVYSLHEVVRAEAYSGLFHLISVQLISEGVTIEPKLGEILPLSLATNEISRVVMSAYVKCLLNEEDKLPVAYACEGLIGALKKLGVAALQLPIEESINNQILHKPAADGIMRGVQQMLAEKAPCQEKFEAENDDEEDDADHDNLVMDSVTDLIGQLAKVLGANFAIYFDEFQKYLLKFMKPNRQHSDRSMAIGCFGEVVMELGAGSAKYVETLMPLIQQALADPMEGVRRNAAFCLGALVATIGTALVPHYLTLLTWLQPLCTRRDEQKKSDVGGGDVDNAIAAVVRMINVSPTAVPLEHVLPVLVSSLPLREDETEGPLVYKLLADLIVNQEPTALKIAPQIISAQIEVLFTGARAMDETKSIAVGFLKQLAVLNNGQFQSTVISCVSQIPDAANQQAVQQMLS